MAIRKNTYIAVLALIIFSSFLIIAEGQRGGSGSSSSSQSSSSRSSSGRSHHRNSGPSWYLNPSQNCTTVNNVTTCTYTEEPYSWTTYGVGGSIIVAFFVFAVNSNKKNVERRKKTIEEVMNDYEGRVEATPSTLDETQRSAMIDDFMKKSYTMVINVGDKSEKFYCQVKVQDLKKQNESKYLIQLSGKDEVGPSKLEGLLVFRADGLGLRLSKVYDNRQKAQQTGKYDILLYEGAGNPQKMEGEWSFYGFEYSMEYAGSWTMLQV